MAGVFQNIDPPSPSPPGECVLPPPLVRGEDTLARRRGGCGVNILEDVRHSSALYLSKYFVLSTIPKEYSPMYKYYRYFPHNSPLDSPVTLYYLPPLSALFIHHSESMLLVRLNVANAP